MPRVAAEGGEGVWVVFSDAIGDAFELLGHVPHVVVVAASHDQGQGDIPTHQDCDCQADQRGLELASEQSFTKDHCRGPV